MVIHKSQLMFNSRATHYQRIDNVVGERVAGHNQWLEMGTTAPKALEIMPFSVCGV